ncbi:hypothetical protein [Andreprevotia chitinilytica]|uniref:hypothetical protein n=1 Tax=Andreprevotia chitinilytica TaxID=396808 RepID=UPI00054FA5C9|nr:hypothetical protein [Andreprevotia chitinilytica]
MKAPVFGCVSHEWLRELSSADLELLDKGLCELLRKRPGAFSLFTAKAIRDSIQCILFDRYLARGRVA